MRIGVIARNIGYAGEGSPGNAGMCADLIKGDALALPEALFIELIF